MEFRMESQELKEPSFAIVFRKNKSQYFQNKVKCSFFWLFLPKFRQKWIFQRNWVLSHFIFYSPLTSCKKSEKTNEPILRKTLDKQLSDEANDSPMDGLTNQCKGLKYTASISCCLIFLPCILSNLFCNARTDIQYI